jgi:signal transduction histidine kinase
MAEVNRGFHLRAIRTPFYTEQFLADDEVLYEEIRQQVVTQLAFVNLVIFAGSAAAGYFLAGRTLAPIENMLEEQKRFVGDASHELRTPLTSLKTEIEVALRNKSHSRETRELLESNLEEVNKMQSLTTYLLSLTRYVRGDLKLTKERMSLDEAVLKSIKSVSVVAEKRSVQIETHISEAQILGNKASIIELSTILLDNAIKYSKPNSKIVVSVSKKSGASTLEVKDFGMGIMQTDLPYIFNRFYRSDGSRNKQKVEGYGLGLSIAKSIVELHNAKITVKSTLEKGTTFSIVFSH